MLSAHVLREVFGPFKSLSADVTVVRSVFRVGAQMSLQFVPAGTLPAAYVARTPQSRPPAKATSQCRNINTAGRALAARVVVSILLRMLLFVRRVLQRTILYGVKPNSSDKLTSVNSSISQALLG